jgi:hypothetical protein
MATKHPGIDCFPNRRRDFFVFFQGLGSALANPMKLTKQTTYSAAIKAPEQSAVY